MTDHHTPPAEERDLRTMTDAELVQIRNTTDDRTEWEAVDDEMFRRHVIATARVGVAPAHTAPVIAIRRAMMSPERHTTWEAFAGDAVLNLPRYYTPADAALLVHALRVADSWAPDTANTAGRAAHALHVATYCADRPDKLPTT